MTAVTPATPTPTPSLDLSTGTMMRITDQEFTALRRLVYDRFGINLTAEKRSLMVSRLQKLVQSLGFTTFESYYHYLIHDPTNQGLDALINRITTNYSYFFREEAHFDFFTHTALPTILERLQQRNSKDLRIWTAGCSTGEEPYSLLMLMHEHLGLNYGLWDAGLLATDISERVLAVARSAVYPAERTSKVPPLIRQRYLHPTADGMVAVNEGLKKELTLRRFNLMNVTFPFKKPFQMIFCRNVMIYFDQPTREALIRRFHQALEPGGYLFIGHSETIGREHGLFQYVMPACYLRL